jgi:exonuclease SbcD
LVDLDAFGVREADFVPAPVPRPLARLRGTLDELLADPRLEQHERSWVQATLTDDVRPLQAMDRLRRRFPHTLALGFEPAAGAPAGVPTAVPRGRSDHAIALDFVEQMRGATATEAESALLLAACDACCEDPDVDVLVSGAADR